MSHLRLPVEQSLAAELAALSAQDQQPRPENWLLSPRAVTDFLCGTRLADGTLISPKFVGPRRVIEVAVATLVTDRALLLIGLPGTAKTYVAEHLAAAISGQSTMIVQGTAGTHEDAIRYGWNYARLIAEGPSAAALVKSPVMRAMENGWVVRIEELTRLPSDVQDALITILSEKIMPIPELDTYTLAQRGFNVIATANDRDRGIHEMSSALRRRFNTVVLPLPATTEEEVSIVEFRVRQLGVEAKLPQAAAPIREIQRLVTIFRELREGQTTDGKVKIKSPSSTLSTAEAISVMHQSQSLACYFSNGQLQARDLAASLTGAIIKDAARDTQPWNEYLETIVRKRTDWKDLYDACKELQA